MEYREVWKSSITAAGLFEVSSLGRVKSVSRLVTSRGGKRKIKGSVIFGRKTPRMYPEVRVRVDGVITSYFVHRLVAEVFVDNPDNKPFVNHIDGNKQNNHPDNLEWCTQKENVNHALDTGLTKTIIPVVAKRADGFGYWFPKTNAVKSIGFHPGNVSTVCSGGMKTYKGFTWVQMAPEDYQRMDYQEAVSA